MQLQETKYLKVKIESMAPSGQGFCRSSNLAIFVSRAAVGDIAEIELYDIRKGFAHAKIKQVIEPSQARIEAPCKLFKVCGGCQWQHINYDSQLEYKTDIVRQALKHNGSFESDLISAVLRNTLRADQPFFYRNKVQFPVTQTQKSKRILAGYYKEGSHEIVNVKHCPVQSSVLDTVLELAKLLAEECGISAYDENKHKGELRHFIFRESFYDKNILVTLVINVQKDLLSKDQRHKYESFAESLMLKAKHVVGVCLNFNTKRGNRILGDSTMLLSGKNQIVEILASKHEQAPNKLKEGLKFALSTESFFQVNSYQAVTLLDLVYEAVYDFTKINHISQVPLIVDAFAGVGTIAAWISSLAQKVIAIEEIESCKQDCESLKQINFIDNLEISIGKVEEIFPILIQKSLLPQVLILDPPRKGVDSTSLANVLTLLPKRIIYVSCNPVTLARDLSALCERAYKLVSVQPLDMFPQTFHVESLAVLDLIAKNSNF